MIEATPRSGRTRSVASSRLLVASAAERGIDVGRCLRGTGLTTRDLDDPSTLLDASLEARIVENVVEALGDPPLLGLSVGLRYHVTTLDLVGLAAMSSETLGDAMAVALRYVELTFALTRVSLERQGRTGRIVVQAHEIAPSIRRFALERSIGVLFALARDLAGEALLCRQVRFALPPPAPEDARRFAELLGIAPSFGCERTEIEFDGEVLGRTLRWASPVTHALAVERCEDALEATSRDAGTGGRVRAVLAAKDANADMLSVATSLGLSSRTLRRRLDEEGTTFSAIRDDVRASRACELLETTTLTVDEIASRVGFSDATSFIASFKRRHGATPRNYRLRTR